MLTTNFASKHRLAIAAAIAVIAATIVLLTSPVFQQCVASNRFLEHSSSAGAGSAFSSLWWCGGIFAKENGEAISAIAAVVVAAFTGTLWWATIEQGKLTKEALVVTTRAFVFIEDFTFQITSHVRRAGSDPEIAEFQVSPKWRNSGDTPTKALKISVAVGTHHGELPENFAYAYDAGAMAYFIGPKANEWTPPIEVTSQTANSALNLETNLYIWARADYQDVFGAKRFTLSCSKIVFGIREREVEARFILHGPYNRTDED